ncbi:SDR family NAD(P)-dependent oxidoreductase [Polynucleobacter sp. AP-Kaivos-20-H2]|uniref:SDR family NAD(P)-dependent oxidoreductase n=1 Tax=Polynucleobacter sp. AP-Kaivos-20-H2 TaxID=2689104 RepID=UPI001C0D94BD|nr:SDR family NAD(P)-dependent oxidoreductase [Polynucleobacter sp. AP-Kaivos-20-H2]MBU3605047.1 SDR family NAD(P)-dependent oxidoreductase [Polynucleobacter sp. AP-Kaivos-20-H2]
MSILPNPFSALVIGASGTIGSHFVKLLESDTSCSRVIGIHRNSDHAIDYSQPETIEASASSLAELGPFQLIINTIGVLHSEQWMPEKKLDDLNSAQLAEMFNTNTIGPALTIKHFSKVLDQKHGVMATLSAKVGSIEDNRLGGWYSYRASKAALNMIIKTASIEFARTKPNIALIALHPSTVKSGLSQPFRGQQIGRDPLEAVTDMFNVLANVNKEDSGSFLTYSGEKLPW